MLINGRDIAEEIYNELEESLSGKRVAFVIFKDDPASSKFVEMKSRIAERLGVEVSVIKEMVSSTEETVHVIEDIQDFYDGIVIQLPLPPAIDTEALFDSLAPEQDIDMLGRVVKQEYMESETDRIPPVAAAVAEILSRQGISLEDREILILGKGRLVGEPVSMMLERQGLSHNVVDKDSDPEAVTEYMARADIIISGIGVPHFIKPEMIKKEAIIIDAGTSESEGKLVGDAHPDCEDKVEFMTPVPGGVGPITVACLYRNLSL